jgi:hypothetical protein
MGIYNLMGIMELEGEKEAKPNTYKKKPWCWPSL